MKVAVKKQAGELGRYICEEGVKMYPSESERVYREQERLAVSMYLDGRSFAEIEARCPLVRLETVRMLALTRTVNLFDGVYH